MKKWTLVAVVVVLLVAVAALASVALAQGPTEEYGSGYRMGPGNALGRASFGMGPRWGGSENSPIAVIAEKLGMTTEELIAELQAGKTVAQVAEERGVALDTIVDALVALHAERLAEAVAAGRLTQEQADAILTTLKDHITARLNGEWSPRGPGHGPGFVDEDGDGKCDNFVDEDGDGVCDHAGPGHGPGFADEDGDGVCDHAGSGGHSGYRGGGPQGRWMQ